MANENKVIKSLNAQNYTGNYEVVSGKWNVSGTFNTDGQKQINNISGMVKKDEAMILSFRAWGSNSDNLRYSFNDISGLETLQEAVDEVISAISNVTSELREDKADEAE